MRNALFAAMLLPAFYGQAAAGTAVSGVTVSTHRSLASVAIRAIVSGDDDSSAVLRVFQGYNADLDSGMVMVRRVVQYDCGPAADEH